MQHKKTIEFKRSIKTLATQMGWTVEVVSGSGPTERIVISYNELGKRRRLATIIIRKDRKEITPGEARMVLRKLRARQAEVADDHETIEPEDGAETPETESGMLDNLKELIDWLTGWF